MASAALPHAPAKAAPGAIAITAVISLATFMQVLDSTIANVALPHMQASLGAAADTVTWVLTSYIVATAIAMPLTGWLGDAIGRRNLILISITGFTITSALCGFAQSLEQMVLFRIFQGAFGAFVIPVGQSFILDAFPREKQGQAMAWWGIGVMLGPVMGPVLGGWLTDSFNWRYVFFINVPVGLICLTGALAVLPAAPRRLRRFDIAGFTMLAVGLGALQLMLDRGQQLDWFESWEVRIEAMIAAAAMWMFAVHMATARSPLFDRRLFTDKNAVYGFGFAVLIGVMLMSSSALLPVMLQTLLGYPVMTSGLVLAPRGIGTMVMMLIVGQIIAKVDPRKVMAAGLILIAIGMWMMSGFSSVVGTRAIIISGVIQGMGMGCMFVPLNTIAFATLPPMLRTDASSIYTLLRNIGGSIGVSICVAILARQQQVVHSDLAAHLTPYSLTLDPAVLRAFGAPGAVMAEMMNGMVNAQAAMVAYIDVFRLLAWVTLLAIPIVLIVRRPPSMGGAPHPAGE